MLGAGCWMHCGCWVLLDTGFWMPMPNKRTGPDCLYPESSILNPVSRIQPRENLLRERRCRGLPWDRRKRILSRSIRSIIRLRLRRSRWSSHGSVLTYYFSEGWRQRWHWNACVCVFDVVGDHLHRLHIRIDDRRRSMHLR